MMHPRLTMRLRAVLASALLVSLELLAIDHPAATLASCNPGRAPHDRTARYVVTMGNISSLTGVTADILEYDPYYTAYNATGTNASEMLVKYSPTQWAQLGWLKSKLWNGTVQRSVFLEFHLSSSQNYYQFMSAEPLGTSTWYEILFSSPSTFYFYVNGTHWFTETGSIPPTQYQFFGETHDWEDQMPGGYNAHDTFTSTDYFQSGVPYSVTTAIQYGWPFGGSHPSTARYDVWDAICPS